MAYISQYSGQEIDANIAINDNQNTRLTTIENKLNTIDEGANKLIDSCIQTSYLQDKCVTVEKLAPEVADSLASIKMYQGTLLADNWIDELSDSEDYASLENKWKWERFPYQSSVLTSTIRNTLLNASPSEIKYINDTEIATGFDFGENYIARCTIYIYCKKAIDLTFTFTTDDDSCLYLNSTFIRSNASTTAQTAVLQFKQGINIVEVFYREVAGKDGWSFAPAFNSYLGAEFSAMYAVPAHTYYQIITPICLDGTSQINSNTIFSSGMILNGSISIASLRDRINTGYIIGNDDGSIKISYNHTIPVTEDITMYWFGKSTV